MLRPLAICLLSVTAAVAQAAPPSPDELLAAKLAAPFLQQAPWLTDWDQALAKAKAEQRLVFGYFTTVNH